MKNFRKVAAVLLTVAFICVLALSLVACGEPATNYEKTITIVVGEGETQQVFADYKTGSKYLFDAINELANRETDPVKLEGNWTQYGLFVTAIGNIEANPLAQYICVMTNDSGHQDVTDWAVTRKYGEITVVSSDLGVSSLPLKDGAVYMFVVVGF